MIRQLSKLIIHLKTIRIMKRDYRFIYLFVVAVFVFIRLLHFDFDSLSCSYMVGWIVMLMFEVPLLV